MLIPRQTRFCWLAFALSAALICGCVAKLASSGSGGSGGGGGGGSTADFSISANTSSLSLTQGTQQPVSLSATALNGFSGTIGVVVSGLPAGVTATPSSFNLVPGTPQQVALAASASAAASTSTVQFVATSGALSHTAPVTLIVKPAVITPGVDVVTYHYDIGRTGLNASETILTPSNVSASNFGLLMLLPVDGLVDGQPLYLSSLTAGGQQRNVVYVVTENDSVYAFDADSGAQIWKTSVLGANETTSGDHGCGQITPQIGITSTPVIDRSAGPNGTIFVVGMSLDKSGAYHQRLHALDVTTGAELANSPSEIHATYPGTGANSSGGNVVFDPAQYAERAGLLLLNGVIYMGWTSHCDADPYTGWLMGYNESTLAQSTVLNLTPNGSEGSIWMAGAGLAADSSGNIYFLDANGTFDPTLNANGFPASGDFGNGFIKVSTTSGTLAVADYFESNNTVNESAEDLDLGSGGALVLPDLTDTSGTIHHLAVGAGKDQNIYVVNRDSMGKFNAQNNNAIYQEITGAIGGVWSHISTTPFTTERSAIPSKPFPSSMPGSHQPRVLQAPTVLPIREPRRQLPPVEPQMESCGQLKTPPRQSCMLSTRPTFRSSTTAARPRITAINSETATSSSRQWWSMARCTSGHRPAWQSSACCPDLEAR